MPISTWIGSGRKSIASTISGLIGTTSKRGSLMRIAASHKSTMITSTLTGEQRPQSEFGLRRCRHYSTVPAWHLFAVFIAVIASVLVGAFPLLTSTMLAVAVVVLTGTITPAKAFAGFNASCYWW